MYKICIDGISILKPILIYFCKYCGPSAADSHACEVVYPRVWHHGWAPVVQCTFHTASSTLHMKFRMKNKNKTPTSKTSTYFNAPHYTEKLARGVDSYHVLFTFYGRNLFRFLRVKLN